MRTLCRGIGIPKVSWNANTASHWRVNTTDWPVFKYSHSDSLNIFIIQSLDIPVHSFITDLCTLSKNGIVLLIWAFSNIYTQNLNIFITPFLIPVQLYNRFMRPKKKKSCTKGYTDDWALLKCSQTLYHMNFAKFCIFGLSQKIQLDPDAG